MFVVIALDCVIPVLCLLLSTSLIKDSSESEFNEPLIDSYYNSLPFDIESVPLPEKNVGATFAKMVAWVRPEFYTLLYATVALVVSTMSGLAQPYYFGKILEASTTDKDTRRLNSYCLLLLIFFATGGFTSLIRGWLYTLVGERVVQRLRTNLFHKIVHQDVAFFDTNKTGELMNRLSSDTTTVQSALTVNVSQGLRSGAQVLFSVVFLFITSWKLSLAMVAVVPVLLVTVKVYGKYIRTLSKEYQDALAQAADSGTESISNARTMRSFGAEELECKRYSDGIAVSYEKGAAKAFAYGAFIGVITFVGGLAVLVVVYLGSRLVIAGDLGIASLTSFILYTAYITLGLGSLSSLYSELMNALGASERIFAILETEPDIGVQTTGRWPGAGQTCGSVEFKDVSFSYPTRPDVPVLSGFSMQVAPKHTVALVGPSGSGKSTVLSLLQRFYDVRGGVSGGGGSISIDGWDIRSLDPLWVHRYVAIVSQEPVLFSGTIRSNIRYSRSAAVAADRGRCGEGLVREEATQEEIERVARIANAHEFIVQFPDGYDTVVGERGVSALDSESEALVKEAIDALMTDRTVIVVAHRLSTVRDAHRIVYMDRGVVQATGTHDELLLSSPAYRRLVQRQLQWGDEAGTETETDAEMEVEVEVKEPIILCEDKSVTDVDAQEWKDSDMGGGGGVDPDVPADTMSDDDKFPSLSPSPPPDEFTM
eukprot:gene8195-16847_t